MSKIARQYRDNLERMAPPAATSWSVSPGTMLGAIAVGVYALILVSLLNWQLSRQTQGNLEDQLARIENRLAQLPTKADQASARAAPAQRGPDPNRVYTVKTDGAPFKGASNAPITIAEFSDYQ